MILINIYMNIYIIINLSFIRTNIFSVFLPLTLSILILILNLIKIKKYVRSDTLLFN